MPTGARTTNFRVVFAQFSDSTACPVAVGNSLFLSLSKTGLSICAESFRGGAWRGLGYPAAPF